MSEQSFDPSSDILDEAVVREAWRSYVVILTRLSRDVTSLFPSMSVAPVPILRAGSGHYHISREISRESFFARDHTVYRYNVFDSECYRSIRITTIGSYECVTLGDDRIGVLETQSLRAVYDTIRS